MIHLKSFEIDQVWVDWLNEFRVQTKFSIRKVASYTAMIYDKSLAIDCTCQQIYDGYIILYTCIY